MTQLYRYFNGCDQLLYVGVSRCAATRINGHCSKEWFDQISRIMVANFATRKQALAAEKTAIKIEHPLFNRFPKTSNQKQTILCIPVTLEMKSQLAELARSESRTLANMIRIILARGLEQQKQSTN